MTIEFRRLSNLPLAVFAAASSLAPLAAAAEQPPVAPRNSTVFISTQSSPPDYLFPWQRMQAEAASGSGVIIEGQRILTNAHVVLHAVSVEVRRDGIARRWPARVSYICHACDLALLEVDEDDFFDGAVPLPLGGLPRLQDQVQVYGYPVGGEGISVTSGVVSRIEVGMYAHSMDFLLLVQIDASLNSGNSGGPVVADERLVGIAGQLLEEAENIGYMVPAPIIRHFLDDIADGRYDGFPRIGAETQGIENPALRRRLHLPADRTGALVTRINHGSPAELALRPGDVILAIDASRIAEDLMVNLPAGARISFEHLIRNRQVGDVVTLEIWRDGKARTVPMTLAPWKALVPNLEYPDAPRFYMFGGLVFQPLLTEFLTGLEDPPPNLMSLYLYGNLVTSDRREIVIISNVLQHPVNTGYAEMEGSIVASVDGLRVRDFSHLAALIDRTTAPFIEIVTDAGLRIVLDAAKARESSISIRRSYGMTADRSEDLRGGAKAP